MLTLGLRHQLSGTNQPAQLELMPRGAAQVSPRVCLTHLPEHLGSQAVSRTLCRHVRFRRRALLWLVGTPATVSLLFAITYPSIACSSLCGPCFTRPAVMWQAFRLFTGQRLGMLSWRLFPATGSCLRSRQCAHVCLTLCVVVRASGVCTKRNSRHCGNYLKQQLKCKYGVWVASYCTKQWTLKILNKII